MTTSIAHQWRPASFRDLVGQEHVRRVLTQAVLQGRIAPAYLFCGPRGTGKTTTARVLARAVNCAAPQEGDPCGDCAACVAIADGLSVDVVEIDAASNRGIDDIRALRDRAQYQPTGTSRKVYIIDEVHMLTDAAANAFLKTLEEPPERVTFILCTTEADRMLPTLLSRCQRYDFRRLPSAAIVARLGEIVDHEAAVVEPGALELIGRHAEGSMRDAQNLLEQLLVSADGAVTPAQVREMLGLAHGSHYVALARRLLEGDAPGRARGHQRCRPAGRRTPAPAPADSGPAARRAAAVLGGRPRP